MNAFFHIGRPKTGSTTLQVFLHENAEALGRQGVFYKRMQPEVSSQWEFPLAALTKRDRFVGEVNIRRALQFKSIEDQAKLVEDRMTTLRQDLDAAPGHMATWIGSSEHASPLLRKKGLVKAFDKIMGGFFDRVDYVVYLRRQEDLIPSAYAEAVRRGETMDFDAYIEKFLDRDHGNHMERLDRWREVVGKRRLHVRLLERDALTEGDLITDFCAVCGIDPSGLVRPEPENQGLSEDGVRRTQMLNRGIASKDTMNPLRWRVRKKLERTLVSAADSDDRLRLPDDMVGRVRAHFAQSNENVRAAFFPDRAELFPPRQVETPA